MEKLNGLRCRECGRHYPAAPVHVCEFCFGPLEVDYRYDALRGRVTRASIEAGPPSMWRYKDLLPIDGDVAVGHHVGFTPMIRARNLADELGAERSGSRTIRCAIRRGHSRIASCRWRSRRRESSASTRWRARP